MALSGKETVKFENGKVLLEWDLAKVELFLRHPDGVLGRELMEACARTVLEGARRRALRQTGAMAGQMRAEVSTDEYGLYADIISPVQSQKRSTYAERIGHGFPYAIVHEAKRVRDRRPHRSLRPALRDIKRLSIVEGL